MRRSKDVLSLVARFVYGSRDGACWGEDELLVEDAASSQAVKAMLAMGIVFAPLRLVFYHSKVFSRLGIVFSFSLSGFSSYHFPM